ncbi:Uu.00g040370.m01.CDS01 [Anthostomella pinea]|uniref:Uu.00g040370.m01.CDS01 n=1 Tax=Anthostomella pinea TaxID=933095 RepID=A0AAI8VA61_9PEZI|nr:Uu.00g040370.m01.CDS01 [Anthostomella pinea]
MGDNGQPVLGSLYVYAPNKGAPVFFAIAFAASAVGHIWQCYRYRCFKMIGLHPVCAVLFAAGYALREYGSFNFMYSPENPSLIIFILSQVCIYVCPPLLELANYHVLGRVLYYVPYLAPLPPGRVLSTFGGLMALIELLNSLGVALSANPSSSHSQQELGSHLTIAALTLQFGVIITFMIIAVTFHRRCANANIRVKAVSTPLITLYISMGLILLRCIYRLVEHVTGSTTVDLNSVEALNALSPILRYEWYFYVFEATLMLINSVLWNVWNPGRYLPRNHHVYLAKDGTTEIQGEEAPDERSFANKAGHVLTFGILFRRKEARRGFQELEELSDARPIEPGPSSTVLGPTTSTSNH